MNIKTRALRHEVHFVPSPERFSYERDGRVISDGDAGGYHRPEAGNMILVGSEDPACDDHEWIAIFGRIRSNLSTGQVKNLHLAIEEEASRHFPAHIEVRPTGDEKLWNNLIDALGEGVYRSLLSATLLITVLFVILVRSLRGALICMVPNVVPILYCMGAWGILGIPIDLGSAIIASIVIGIAADDTIHFVTRFNKELVRSQDFNEALSSTFRTCGRALFYTTMTLSLGFSIFMLSTFGPLKNGGRLSVPPVIVAFLADMIIFPALLLTFKPGFMKKRFSL